MKRHILDEHIIASHVDQIRRKIPSIAQIGTDWGESGWDDIEQIIPHLHHSKATFHTLDEDFFKRRFLHNDYCIIFYDLSTKDFVEFFQKILKHHLFDTHAKRLGKIIKVSLTHLDYWDSADHQIHETSW